MGTMIILRAYTQRASFAAARTITKFSFLLLEICLRVSSESFGKTGSTLVM